MLKREGWDAENDGIVSVHNSAEEAELAKLELILQDEPGTLTIKRITWDGRTVTSS